MASKVPNVLLSNGVEIPIIGLGTYKALGEEIKASVNTALEIGYRHFDTADFYKNLEPLGEAIREAIAAGKVTREEVFLTTKIWPTYYGPGRVEASVRRQLKQTGLEKFDLVLLHWPVVLEDSDTEGFPCDENGQVKFGTRPLPEVYAELETTVKAGLTRTIGVSNFNAAQISSILATSTIPPAMNQVECHVYLSQQKLQTFCKQHNIAITAYCPLGAGGTKPNSYNVLEDATLKSVAGKYAKTSAHVALKYLLQRQIIIIPKSIRRERLEANFNLFDFEISAEDMATLDGLNKNERLVPFDYFGSKKSPLYPFDAEF